MVGSLLSIMNDILIELEGFLGEYYGVKGSI